MKPAPRFLALVTRMLLALFLAGLLAACGNEGSRSSAIVPLEIDRSTSCALDGMILAVRIADNKEALLRRPGKGAITSLAWSSTGKLLAFASEAGDCGVVDITG